MALIRVINPNSNQSVTDAIAASLKGFAIPGRIDIVCETLETGPIGIENERHVASVAIPMVNRMKTRSADAYVIACYSDPALALAREELGVPVFGIMQSAVMQACTLGTRFGVIALSNPAIKRHERGLRAMGMLQHLAAERAINSSVAASADADAFVALQKAGRALRDEDGADIVILGCAGMARHRTALQDALGIPVIDPTQAGVASAMSVLLVSATT
ncbi:MAG: aspartate/glutamate racemase family protein [Paracoccaceae bacterium]